MVLSEAEKTFILHGVEQDRRADGRKRGAYRPMEIEVGLVGLSYGSARLRLANTDVLVSVKLEIDVPLPDSPKDGKLEFFVDCSANATPDFEGRGGDDLATEISNILAAAYKSSSAFDSTKLCILPGRKCWKLYVDILILECGGNLYDAVSLAVKSALWHTQIPHVISTRIDGTKVEMDVSEDLDKCDRLDVTGAPLLVTVCKIGNHCIVDPTDDEEHCSGGLVVVAVSKSSFSTILQKGGGSLHPNTLLESLKLGQKAAINLDQALINILLNVDTTATSDFGFLK